MLKKILKATAVILLIIIVGGFFYIRHTARKALPDYNATVELKGLKGEVEVFRDSHAIPTIYASCEKDLYTAVGYVTAQDRLWQMDLLRRVTTGRLSEIFGEDFVQTDLLMRSLRIPEKSAMVLEKTGPEVVDALEAFARGVNYYIEQNRGKLPPEFSILGYSPEKWKPEHSVNLTGYMAWELNTGWSTKTILHKLGTELEEEKFKELVPDMDLQTSYVYPEFSSEGEVMESTLLEHSSKLRDIGAEIFTGSNNWAVSGEKSTTGKSLLANDMHLGLFAPGIWYQMHHVIDGELNVSGVVLPGQPFVIAGHNKEIAWGMTNVMLDDMDFYKETVHPSDPQQYKYMEQWKDMEVRDEVIKTGEGDSVVKKLKFTHRGPVISDLKNLDDKVVSMKWTGNWYSNEVRSVYLLNRASNWEEFRKAVKTFLSVSQNIIYADTEGNIGLQTAAGVPVRKQNRPFIAPGEDDTYDWQGAVPFEELPYSYNPPEGFVASANNRMVPDDYPYYISSWYDLPFRYDRIKEMLTGKEKLSVEDFKNMLSDKKSKLAEKMVPGLLNELEDTDRLSAAEESAAQMLARWDMVYSPESPEALIFEKFYNRFVENLLLEGMGKPLYNEFISDRVLVRNIVNLVWTNKESAWLKGENNTFSETVTNTFSETVEALKANFGNDPELWAWGDVHKLTINHPMSESALIDRVFSLSRGPFFPGGSFHTVCPYSYDYTNPFEINHGASQRHIYPAGNWDSSLVIIPTGTSGIPASRYYCSQSEDYVNNRFHRKYFNRKPVEEKARYKMKLTPAEN